MIWKKIQRLIPLLFRNKKYFIIHSAIEKIFIHASDKVKTNIDRTILEKDLLNIPILEEMNQLVFDGNKAEEKIKIYIDNYLKDCILRGMENVYHMIEFPKFMEENPYRFDLWKNIFMNDFNKIPSHRTVT